MIKIFSFFYFTLMLILNIFSLSNKHFLLKPNKTICKEIYSEKDSIITFYIDGLEKKNKLYIYITENRQMIKKIKKSYIEKEIIYITRFGGNVELCIKSKEKKNINLEIISKLGLKTFEKTKNLELIMKNLKKDEKKLKKINKNFWEYIEYKKMNKDTDFFKRVLNILIN